jgi:hypothetical protein
MIVIAGLVIVAATVIVGAAGVLANSGHAHAIAHFAVLGYHVTSTGAVFLYGTVVGALAMLGLSLLAADAGRSSRRDLAARASLAQSRRETAAVSQHRDDLISQRDTARAYTVFDEQRNYTASTLGDGSPASAAIRARATPGRPGRADPPETLPGQAANVPAAQIPASAPAPAE